MRAVLRITSGIAAILIVILISGCKASVGIARIRTTNSLSLRYALFNGEEKADIFMQSGDLVLITYKGEVKKGKLSISLRSPSGGIALIPLDKKFIRIAADSSGEYSLIVAGVNTSGGFQAEWQVIHSLTAAEISNLFLDFSAYLAKQDFQGMAANLYYPPDCTPEAREKDIDINVEELSKLAAFGVVDSYREVTQPTTWYLTGGAIAEGWQDNQLVFDLLYFVSYTKASPGYVRISCVPVHDQYKMVGIAFGNGQ